MKSRRHAQASAFSLIEVVMAIGIVSFAMLILVGLVVVGLNSNRQTVKETEATNILSLVQADVLSITPGSTANSAIYGITSPYYRSVLTATNYLDENGASLGTAYVATARFRMETRVYSTAKLYMNPVQGGVYVSISWPPKPSSVAATGQVESFIGVSR